jgi:hypothetical protein
MSDSLPAAFHVTMINPLRRRRSVPTDLFYEYWRDSHAQIAARIPGLNDLWIHWLSYEYGRLWPTLTGVSSDLPEKDRFDGVPEPRFATQKDLLQFAQSPVHPHLIEDERNIFEMALVYQSLGAHSHTHIDKLQHLTPNGQLLDRRFLLFLKVGHYVSIEQFQEFVGQTLPASLSTSPHLVKLRTHIFEPAHSQPSGAPDDVIRAQSADKQYQAAIEVGFPDGIAMGRFLKSSEWLSTIDKQCRHFRAVHAFGVTHTFTLKYGGALTLCGLRGYAASRQIERLRAVNQMHSELEKLFVGAL